MNTFFVLLFLASLIVLVVGLTKPSIVKQTSRKHVGYIFGGVAILLLVAISVTSPATNTQQQNVAVTTDTPNTTATVASTTQPSAPATTTARAPAVQATPAAPAVPPVQKKVTTPTAPATAPANTQTAPPASSETVSQKNAVREAKSYLSNSAFSHDGLVAQLEYEQFSSADATYGADNSGANWDAEAAADAKSYMQLSGYSRGGLIAQLEYDKFTEEQANHGADSVGL